MLSAGNHDNPKFFKGTIKLSNLQLLPDYSTLHIKGKRILLAGGAISIDRKLRAVNKNYWLEEKFSYNEVMLSECLRGINRVDIVVTHSAPKVFWPFESNSLLESFIKDDDQLRPDLERERKDLDRLLEYLVRSHLKPTEWIYGHFHQSHRVKVKGIKCTALRINELYHW